MIQAARLLYRNQNYSLPEQMFLKAGTVYLLKRILIVGVTGSWWNFENVVARRILKAKNKNFILITYREPDRKFAGFIRQTLVFPGIYFTLKNHHFIVQHIVL
jgi:hypothetical protein